MSVFDRFTVMFNPSDPISWTVLVFLTVLLFVQVWLILRNKTLSGRRKWVRGVLNVLVWSILAGYFLQIEWVIQKDTKSVLIADNEVPPSVLERVKDSLQLRETVRVNAFKSSSIGKQLADGTLDSVTLLGTGFSPDILGQLSRQTVRWIPHYLPDQVHLMHWKGIVRKGELQTINGRIQSSQKQVLKIRFGNQTLDSLQLQIGPSDFKFQFLTFSQGRTEIELVLNQKTVDTIRFFVRKPETVSYQFILTNPDFESKTLADWLGKKGNSVELLSTVSKDMRNRVTINRAVSPDVIITDPSNALNPVVKKAVSQGKPVLFMNASEPETDSKIINQVLGTNWNVRKISNETAVPLGNGIQALPYRFAEAINQLPVAGYPVAVQKTTAKIGFSLVSETFPLKLSGDSVGYDRFWTTILAELQPSFKNNIYLDAPVFDGFQSIIHFNNLDKKLDTIRIGNDTARLDYSSINSLSAKASFRFGQTGWQPIQDSLLVYVDPASTNPVFGSYVTSAYLRTRSTDPIGVKADSYQAFPVKIPDWIWFILFLSTLTALWVEPKF